jgi:hypothetical protein
VLRFRLNLDPVLDPELRESTDPEDRRRLAMDKLSVPHARRRRHG